MQIFAPAAASGTLPVQASPQLSRSAIIRLIALALLSMLLLRTAWVAEDAYIPFRVLDNFLNGYGLRWNVADRVQTYTDPLFLGIVTFVTWLSGNVYLSVIAVSLVLSLAAFVLITRDASDMGAITASFALIFSKAFIDFSISGIENPATHCAIAAYLYFYWRGRDPFLLTLIAALAATNREDTVLFFLPSLGVLYFRTGLSRVWRRALLGWTPCLAWLAFSLFYYGFLFPNTAYAKLNTGIPTRDMIFQGIVYYMNAIQFDTSTIFVISLGLVVAYYAREWALAAGVVLNLIYILRVGGDFMCARFFSASLVFCVALIARYWNPRWALGVPTLALIAGLGLWVPYPTVTTAVADITPRLIGGGVADERSHYYECAGLMHYRRDTLWPLCAFTVVGAEARDSGFKTVVMPNIGYYGWIVGPKVHVVDPFALGDAFLARLPIVKGPWRVGHYLRNLPEGYLDTVTTGVNTIADPNLHEYYSHLHTVISGDLWSVDRFKQIFLFNIGYYDHLVPHTRT